MAVLKKNVWLLALAGICLLTVCLRAQSLHLPLFTDHAIYSYVGHSLLQGGKLYTQLVDNKPPAIYLTHAFGELLFGYRQETVYLTGILAALAACIFLFLYLKNVCGPGWAGLGTLIWALASNSLIMTANVPNVEHYINTFLIIGVWAWSSPALAGKRPDAGGGLRQWVAGAAWGLAAFYKPNFLAVPAALALYLAWEALRNQRPLPWRAGLRLLLPAAAFWAGTAVYFMAQGRYQDFVTINFQAAQGYVGNLWANEWQTWRQSRMLFLPYLRDMWILIALVYAGVAGWAFRKLRAVETHLYWLLIATLFMIGIVFGNGPRYYQLLLPYLAIFSTLALRAGWQAWQAKESIKQMALAAAVIAVVGYLGYFQLPLFTQSREAISEQQFGYAPRVDRKLGQLLGQMTAPEETIFQWGMQAGLYFYSQRPAASGILTHQIFFFAPPDIKGPLYNRMVKEIYTRPPAFFIFTAWLGPLEDDPLFSLFKQNYRFFGLYDKYVIFERQGRPPLTPELRKLLASQTEDHYPWKNPRLVLASEITEKDYLMPRPFQRALFQPGLHEPNAELIRRGNNDFLNQRYGEAKAAWDQALAQNPESPAVLANQGLGYEMAGAYYMCLGNFQNVIDQKHVEHPWLDYYREVQFKLAKNAEELVK